MATAALKLKRALVGNPKPRIAPLTPARSQWKEFRDVALSLGITLYPWQETAGRYLTALSKGDNWLYPEVAVIVGRQNGKTELLKPLIIGRLLAGQRIMHTAQNRELPREIHDAVGTLLVEHFPDNLPNRRGIRYGAGQEEIRLKNGGRYRIVSPTRGGARGPSNDLVIVDELREMVSHEFIGAAEPTLSASANPQMVYLSNAGTEESAVLNGLKMRATEDPSLAYLEWSADPGLAADDPAGWVQSNPAIGHMPGKLEYLERKYTSYRMENQLAIFETEHLCRWVVTMKPRLIPPFVWERARSKIEEPLRPAMGISMDVSGTRASAALAWQQSDGTLALTVLRDVTGDPIDTDRFGPDLKQLAMRIGVTDVAFDSWTDSDLARHLPNAKPIISREYANASENFARVLDAGRLHWAEAEQITDDLAWAARKPHESGAWMAVKANEERPITAILAAIRAVWLASAPKVNAPRLY